MFRRIAQSVKKQVKYYRAVARHPRTPALSKWLLLAALAYLLSPIDLIPDWIPVIGYLDDVVIVPVLVALACALVPGDVRAECRKESELPVGKPPSDA